MRLAVLADTHGNLPALEAVLQDIERQGVDGFVIAGDVTGGPQPEETIALLRSLDGWMIRGNSEEYVLAYHAGQAPAAWCTGAQWATFRWSYQRLSAETLAFISGLPEQRALCLDGALPIRIVHGSPHSSREYLYPNHNTVTMGLYRQAGLLPDDGCLRDLDDAVACVQEPVLVCAHSHISWIHKGREKLVVNPGPVSGPNNCDVRAQYALLTWQGDRWIPELRAVAYELIRVEAAFRDTGFLASGGVMAHAFLLDVLTGRNVPGRLMAHVHRLASLAGLESSEPVPDGLWQQAVDTFDWEGHPLTG